MSWASLGKLQAAVGSCKTAALAISGVLMTMFATKNQDWAAGFAPWATFEGCLQGKHHLQASVGASWARLKAFWVGLDKLEVARLTPKTASWSHLSPSHEHSGDPMVKIWVRKLSQRSFLEDVSNENNILLIPSEALDAF